MPSTEYVKGELRKSFATSISGDTEMAVPSVEISAPGAFTALGFFDQKKKPRAIAVYSYGSRTGAQRLRRLPRVNKNLAGGPA
jgi:hypothetical protein